MRFNVGDTIRHKITKEDGRIVRIAETSLGSVYIVSVPPDQARCAAAREVLWRESEVKRVEVERSLS
jgi:hypothetical protein